ncbi:hypothetical protein Patl1_27495 [Pistacia atlantica]|uniref:Uncharacterized protein n=1 Tax=Pistacia atlantica TaxID=434234 RepID=A0ACC1BCJ2_9ROSI|nr:hypothetical protein Patl1_27495 [Pistacia atlantica]
MEEDTRVYLGNQNNVIHPSQFNQTSADLMNSLAHEAVSSSNFFAAEDVNFTTVTRLYGLVQCTPDIVSSECCICLAACVSEIRKYCNGKEGGRISKPSCNLRFEIYPFYSMASHPPPPPATSTSKIGKHLHLPLLGLSDSYASDQCRSLHEPRVLLMHARFFFLYIEHFRYPK